MNIITGLTPHQLRKAASLKEKIQSLEKALAQLLGSSATTVATPAKPSTKPAKKKGQLSATGRARIVAAQKARWAATRAAVPAAKTPARKKGRMSAATKALLKAKLKAYWAAKKAMAKK